jgi:hypothetical protein
MNQGIARLELWDASQGDYECKSFDDMGYRR